MSRNDAPAAEATRRAEVTHPMWATTVTGPYSADAAADSADAAEPASQPVTAAVTAPASAPAVSPPSWSGRKTAIAAALAIGISSVGAIGAAAALPTGTAQTGVGGGQFQRGGFGPGQLPGGQSQQGTNGTPQQLPGSQPQQQVPGAAPGGVGGQANPNAVTP